VQLAIFIWIFHNHDECLETHLNDRIFPFKIVFGFDVETTMIVGRKTKDRNQQHGQHTIAIEGERTTPWTRFPTFQKPQG